MFRRFLYHFFWNFYDYLGSYLAQGALLVAALFVPLLGTGFVASVMPYGWLRVAALVIGLIAFLILLAAGTAGTFSFAEVASRQAPARFPEFRGGVRLRWKLYLRGLLVAGLAFAVAAANVAFYSHLARGSASSGGRAGLMIASMVFLWIALGIAIYSLPFFAGLARFDAGVWAALRKSFVLFALAPMLWLLVFVFVASLSALCVVSIAGIVFLRARGCQRVHHRAVACRPARGVARPGAAGNGRGAAGRGVSAARARTWMGMGARPPQAHLPRTDKAVGDVRAPVPAQYSS